MYYKHTKIGRGSRDEERMGKGIKMYYICAEILHKEGKCIIQICTY